MRVLIWITKGMLETLASAATKTEDAYELAGIVTDTDDAVAALTSGVAEIVLLGKGRFDEWKRVWSEGALAGAPPFRTILISTLPASTAMLMEAREVGIDDIVDLTMDRDEMGARMIELWNQLRGDYADEGSRVDDRIKSRQLMRDISDETDRQIVALIAQGKFDKEIADELFLSLQTIRNRVSRMLTGSGARNRTHLAMLYTSDRNAPDIPEARQDPDRVA